MALGSLVLSATSPYTTYGACCNASSLESIFDSNRTELDETGTGLKEIIPATVNSMPVTFCLQ